MRIVPPRSCTAHPPFRSTVPRGTILVASSIYAEMVKR